MEIEGMKKKPIFNLNYTHIFVQNICNFFGFKKQIFIFNIFVAFLMEVRVCNLIEFQTEVKVLKKKEKLWSKQTNLH